MVKKAKRVAIYARVCTDQVTAENQLHELRKLVVGMGWLVTREYVDCGPSDAQRDKRAAFHALLKDAARGEIDVIATWSLKCLGSNLKGILGFLDKTRVQGIGLYLHEQEVNTTTRDGKALFRMVEVLAEFERTTTQERITAGRGRAQEQGEMPRQPMADARLDVLVELEIHRLYQSGMGQGAIAKTLGVDTGTVRRVIRKAA